MISTRLIIIFYVAAALTVVSCRQETVSTEQTTAPTVTETTLTGPPQDLSNARVNTVIAPQREYVENSRLGSALGKDQMVETEKTEFTTGEPIYLSMWFRESPAGLQSRVTVEDAQGKEVGAAQHAMDGRKTVTFPLAGKPLAPGKYKVTGYWGGNIAAEYEFTVTASKKAKGAQ